MVKIDFGWIFDGSVARFRQKCKEFWARHVNEHVVHPHVHSHVVHSHYLFRLFIQAIYAWSRQQSQTLFLFEKWWKLCQKMRLNALIIFPTGWHQKTIILRGEQSKCMLFGAFRYIDRKDAPRRADHFSIEWHHNIVILISKRSKYCRRFVDVALGRRKSCENRALERQ